MNSKSEYRNIDELHGWDKNPRKISTDDLERLKKQIKKLGVYKPLIITQDGTVLGGNMRLKALRELGVKKVWVSIVDAPDEKTKLEYALSDNDRAGVYVEEELAQLVLNNPELELENFKVDLGESISLSELVLDNNENEIELNDKYSQNLGQVIYEPKQTNWEPKDLFQRETKFDKEIEALPNEEIKKMLKMRVAFLSKFDFAKIADYYAYQATLEEQRLFEKLGLVLLDRDKLIENGFSKIMFSLDKNYENTQEQN